jgi:VWFA-related protein
MAKESWFAFGRGTVTGFCAWAFLLWIAGSFAARAQDTDILTLHVYTNTIQIPVLVLGEDQRKIAPIAPDRFKVSFDGGPPFRASHVRLEGDDPISLAILLDMSGSELELSTKLENAIAELAPLSLRAKDHVSIYGLDCEFTQYASDMPADEERLKKSIHEALQAASDRRHVKHGSKCESQVHLWDALAFVTNQLSGLSGRRVILAVSDGQDKGSKHKWNEVRAFAQNSAVAVFGMRYVPWLSDDSPAMGNVMEDPFRSICELSGGRVFSTNRTDVAKRLQGFVAMVRGRYIVEFPRPRNSTKGQHQFVVTIDKSKAFIRSTGISVPLPDAKALADPTTVTPSDGNPAPEEGTRHILETPR